MENINGYLTTKQAAEYLGVSRSWLEKLRVFGGGPAFYRVSSRRVLYQRAGLDAWVARHRMNSTSDPMPQIEEGA